MQQVVYMLRTVPIEKGREMLADPTPLARAPISPDAAYVFHGNFSFKQRPGTFGAAMVEIRHQVNEGTIAFIDQAVRMNGSAVPLPNLWRPFAKSLPDDQDLVLEFALKTARGSYPGKSEPAEVCKQTEAQQELVS